MNARSLLGAVGLASSVLFALACSDSGSASPAGGSSSGGTTPDGGGTLPDGANGDGATLPDGAPVDGGGAADVEVEPGPPATRFVGRQDNRDAAGPYFAWPGARIIARFNGTSVKVKLKEQVETWMEGGPSEWDVDIDGVTKTRLVLTAGVADYELATALPAGDHIVELYKRSEAQNGATQFLGWDFAGGALLAPPKAPARKIEIVGDSSIAGFGIEGVGQGPDCPGADWGSHWQNFRKSVGARLSQIVSADLHGTVYSGKGMFQNIWRPDTETMPIIYGRAMPIDPSSTYDLSLYVPDVIVVMMGGNDFAIGQPTDNGAASLADFTQAYRGLVNAFRTRAPNAHVFLAASPSTSDAEPPGRGSRTNVLAAIDTIVAERDSAGDKKVYAANPNVASAAELTGCNGHGTPAFHDRVAQELSVIVKAKTGWN